MLDGEQVTDKAATVGIDVSARWLDVHVAWGSEPGAAFRVGNDAGGWERLIDRLAPARPDCVVLEASGGYEKGALAALRTAGLPARRVNPRRARDFARAAGRLAKTDRIDAQMLAAYGRAITLPVPIERSAQAERLSEHLRVREGLAEEIERLSKMIRQTADRSLRAQVSGLLDRLKTELKTLERRIAALVRADAALSDLVRRLKAVPGIGPVTAWTLAADMPELGRLGRRPIAALAGLAPINRDSGTLRGRRAIAGGRARIRRLLFLDAMAAVRKGAAFHQTYLAKRRAGKPGKIALVAIARKILIAANAIVRDNAEWKPA